MSKDQELRKIIRPTEVQRSSDVFEVSWDRV
jgi:hypothetical protein